MNVLHSSNLYSKAGKMSLHEDGSARLQEKEDTNLFVSTSGDEVFAIRRIISVQNVRTETLLHLRIRIFIGI